MTATIGVAVSPGGSIEDARLAPGVGYLRVTLDGAVALFALGFIDYDQNGPIEVYYGPGREVLRLQNGRLLGLESAIVNWREVRLSSNPTYLGSAANAPIVRRRDVTPGEVYDLTDQVLVKPGAPAPRSLQGLDATTLSWFDESADDLPVAHVALDQRGTPIYGEQCLTGEHCLTWQLWPPEGTK